MAQAAANGDASVNELIPPETKGCLFDMDGTLLDSTDQRVRSWNQAVQKHGLTMDKETYLNETGKAGPLILESLCQQQGKSLSDEVKQGIIKDMTEFFVTHGLPQSQPIPAIVRIAEVAQARGLKLALATGSEEEIIHKTMTDFGLGNLFKVVVSSQNVGRTKPEPDIFLAAAERIGLKASECVVFEDSKSGLQAGRAAGAMRVVDVTTLPGHPEFERRQHSK
ncbi:HAD-like domain-containing protein [Dunaliella salina]|uniref:HAD-like domain-containing protein n=1 Tax=Dunaliella salina TaxID=3046 RepID=A0ABQ7GI32_DUNSA|nr:HAD-like domain-containing protein [Dunaliella salina]|eukprot:KAF5834270.1 HAD-like domain-containing protein [Dunaliella salina]